MHISFKGGAPYERARELEAHGREEDKGGRSAHVVYISFSRACGAVTCTGGEARDVPECLGWVGLELDFEPKAWLRRRSVTKEGIVYIWVH